MYGCILLCVVLIKFVNGNVDGSNYIYNEIVPNPLVTELTVTDATTVPTVQSPRASEATTSGTESAVTNETETSGTAATDSLSPDNDTTTTTVKLQSTSFETKLQTTDTLSTVPPQLHSISEGFHVELPKGGFIRADSQGCTVTAFTGAVLNTAEGSFRVSSAFGFKIEAGNWLYAPIDGDILFERNCSVLISAGARKKPGELKQEPVETKGISAHERMLEARARVRKSYDDINSADRQDEVNTIIFILLGILISGFVFAGVGGLIACSVCSCLVANREKEDSEICE